MQGLFLVFAFFALSFKTFDITVGDFNLRVSGEDSNIPRYTYWLTGSNVTYDFRLKSIYEVDKDGKKVGPVINPVGWFFSNLTETASGAYFTMTFTGGSKGRFGDLIFKNHVNWKNNTNTTECPYGVCLKYDVILTNYVWWSTDASTSLEFQYWIERYSEFVFTFNSTETPNAKWSSTSSLLNYGDSYYSIFKTAQSGKVGTVPVLLSFDEKNSDVLVRYGHFDSNLTHDPTLGFPSSNSIGWLVVAIIVGCILVLGIFLGALILWNRQHKKNGYEQL